MTDLVERRYLLVKRGLYYRPDNKGYTAIKSEAGRYLKSDAIDGVNYAVHEDDAGDFSPSAWEATKGAIIAHLSDHITALEAEIARKDEALRFYADNASYCQLHIPGIPLTDPRSFAPVLQDEGKRARDALSASEIVKEMCGE